MFRCSGNWRPVTTDRCIPLGLWKLGTGAAAGAASGECCSLVNNMIVGSGIDLVEIRRIQRAMDRYGRRFLGRVFTEEEQAYCLRKRNSAESFAARFAAKEAG